MKRILILTGLIIPTGFIYSADNNDTLTPKPIFCSTPLASEKDTLDKIILQWATNIKQDYDNLQIHKTLIVTVLGKQASTAEETVALLQTLGANKHYREAIKETINAIPYFVPTFDPKTQDPSDWAQKLTYNDKMRLAQHLSIPKKLREQYPTDGKSMCSIM